MIWLPAISARRRRATSFWPSWPRAACTRSSRNASVPRQASIDIAAAASAAAHTGSRSASTSAADAGHQVRAVDQRQAFLRLQHQRREPGDAQRLGAADDAAGVRRFAFADQHQRRVRQRREIARRADRADRRHDRRDVRVQEPDQLRAHRGPHARQTARQRRAEQDHHRAHDLDRQRLAHARGVREDQVALHLAQLGVVDALLRQRAEAGVDAVEHLAARHRLLERVARGRELRERARPQRHPRRPARRRRERVDRQRPTVDDQLVHGGIVRRACLSQGLPSPRLSRGRERGSRDPSSSLSRPRGRVGEGAGLARANPPPRQAPTSRRRRSGAPGSRSCRPPRRPGAADRTRWSRGRRSSASAARAGTRRRAGPCRAGAPA